MEGGPNNWYSTIDSKENLSPCKDINPLEEKERFNHPSRGQYQKFLKGDSRSGIEKDEKGQQALQNNR